MNHRQLQVIEYLREENRVLREQLGGRRVRLNDNQRRRLAVKAKALGRKALAEVASIGRVGPGNFTPSSYLPCRSQSSVKTLVLVSSSLFDASSKG